VQFHRVRALGDWLLVHGRTPVAHRGLLGFRSEVWTADGRCAASGSGQLLGRALPPPT
jgi:acyl-CoA thioesterase